jgi:tRNA(fMet)-specific endonuclease VapC
MSARYLLDTNIASYAMRHEEPVRSRLAKTRPEEVAISAITEGELRYGVARHPSRALEAKVQSFLATVAVLPWDSLAAQKYGELRAHLETIGQPAGSLDLLIGAHAWSAGLILVTHDQGLARIKKLKVEDWTR